MWQEFHAKKTGESKENLLVVKHSIGKTNLIVTLFACHPFFCKQCSYICKNVSTIVLQSVHMFTLVLGFIFLLLSCCF